jgi:hypothetical protein
VPISCFFKIVKALQYGLKLGIVMPPALIFLFRIALAIQGLLCFYMYFLIASSISVQNVIGIDWDCVEHVSCFLVVWLFSQC